MIKRIIWKTTIFIESLLEPTIKIGIVSFIVFIIWSI